MSDTDQPSRVVLYDKCSPSLEPGRYTLCVKQTVSFGKETKSEELHSEPFEFRVRGPLEYIEPSVIYSRYPPPNSEGAYASHLAHVVFNRRTLPWEGSDNNVPWLALLVVTEEEIGQAQMEVVKDEASEDVAPRRLRMKKSTFEVLVPNEGELQKLAHVREVKSHSEEGLPQDGVDDTDESGGVSSESSAWFSLVTGARIIRSAGAHSVFLVSLESMTGERLSAEKTSEDLIDLVVLDSWSFQSTGGASFQEVAKNLNRGRSEVALRVVLPQEDHQIEPTFAAALGLGYVPVYRKQHGSEQEVDWYRGPFAPTPSATGPGDRDDQSIGSLSVKTAYQLGRFLALQNQELCSLLLKPEAARAPRPSIGGFLKKVGLLPQDSKSDAGREGEVPTPQIQSVAEWVRRLDNLHGVPLHYLLPDQNLLPPEHFRVFYVDEGWVDEMMEGVLSICPLARSSSETNSKAKDARESWRNFIGKNRPGRTGTRTGILLRSRLIIDWRGMKLRAFGGKEPLAPLRVERLSPDTLLGIYGSVVTGMEIKEPEQGLHFVAEDSEGDRLKFFAGDDNSNNSAAVAVRLLATPTAYRVQWGGAPL